MDLVDALVAVLVLAVALVPIGVLAATIRRRYYAYLEGAGALLASIVLGVSVATVAFELTGVFGLLNRPALVVVGLVAAAAAAWVRRRELTGGDGADTPARCPRWGMIAGLGVAAIVVAQWGARTVTSVKSGVSDYDSLVYHLPHAVRIAQTGATGRAMYVMGDARQAFHSLGSETLQAVGMIATGRTTLVPWFNFGWLLLALLGGWCLLRRAGAAPLGLGIVSVAFAMPLMAVAGAGTAKSDTAATALLVVAVALLLATKDRPHGLVIAGLAAGLALGAKENMLGPFLGLLLVVAMIAPTRRVRAVLEFGLAAGATGGFWLVRNFVNSGNPFPSAHLPLFPSPKFPIGETFDHRLSEYLTNGHVWREVLLPGLRDAAGRGAILIGIVAVAAVVIALVRGDRLARALAVAGMLATAFFIVTPFTAPGVAGAPSRPLYAANTRYGIGALLLCLFAGAVTVTALSQRAKAIGAALVGACALLTLTTTAPLAAWIGGSRKSGAALAVLVLAGAIVAAQPVVRRAASGLHPLALAAAGVVALLGASVALSAYADRYTGGPAPSSPSRPNLISFGQRVAPARIGIVGVELGYPLIGDKLENTVRFVGVKIAHGGIRDAASCAELRRGIAAGHFNYVIVGRAQSDPDQTTPPPALAWLRGAPDATEIANRDTTSVFLVTGSAPDLGAPCTT